MCFVPIESRLNVSPSQNKQENLVWRCILARDGFRSVVDPVETKGGVCLKTSGQFSLEWCRQNFTFRTGSFQSRFRLDLAFSLALFFSEFWSV